jgi:hypothetical protein
MTAMAVFDDLVGNPSSGTAVTEADWQHVTRRAERLAQYGRQPPGVAGMRARAAEQVELAAEINDALRARDVGRAQALIREGAAVFGHAAMVAAVQLQSRRRWKRQASATAMQPILATGGHATRSRTMMGGSMTNHAKAMSAADMAALAAVASCNIETNKALLALAQAMARQDGAARQPEPGRPRPKNRNYRLSNVSHDDAGNLTGDVQYSDGRVKRFCFKRGEDGEIDGEIEDIDPVGPAVDAGPASETAPGGLADIFGSIEADHG